MKVDTVLLSDVIEGAHMRVFEAADDLPPRVVPLSKLEPEDLTCPGKLYQACPLA